MVMLCEGTLKKQHFGLMVSYYGGNIVTLSRMHKTQCVPLEEAGESGSVTSCSLITEGAEAEECLKSAPENTFFPFIFGIMVSSRIPRLNKSFSVVDFYPSFHSSSTYNYPSVSKGGPCHPCLWQRSKRSDAMNGKKNSMNLVRWGI